MPIETQVQVKICPICKNRNPAQEMMCSGCFGDLSAVKPSSIVKNIPEPVVKKVLPSVADDKIVSLSLILEDEEFVINEETVIGREFFFKNSSKSIKTKVPTTVSRKHAKIVFINGEWAIEDIGSINNTWLNDIKIEVKKPCKISNGDTISLSEDIDLIVKIKKRVTSD